MTTIRNVLLVGSLTALVAGHAAAFAAPAASPTKANQVCRIAYSSAIEYRRRNPPFQGDPAKVAFGWAQLYKGASDGLRRVGASTLAARFNEFAAAVKAFAVALDGSDADKVSTTSAKQKSAAARVRRAATAQRATACVQFLNVYLHP